MFNIHAVYIYTIENTFIYLFINFLEMNFIIIIIIIIIICF